MLRNKLLAVAALIAGLLLPAQAMAAYEAYTRADLNLRVGPATTYGIIDVIPYGEPVVVLGCLEDWYWCDIEWFGLRGWVAAQYLVQPGTSVYLPQFAPRVGLPIIGFSFYTYHERHYRERPWYKKRSGRWRGRDWRRDRRDGDRPRYERRRDRRDVERSRDRPRQGERIQRRGPDPEIQRQRQRIQQRQERTRAQQRQQRPRVEQRQQRQRIQQRQERPRAQQRQQRPRAEQRQQRQRSQQRRDRPRAEQRRVRQQSSQPRQGERTQRQGRSRDDERRERRRRGD